MNPSIEALQAFAEVAARGSFSAAARALGKSQSTLSESVANLEIDLGVRLFDRTGRLPVLTPEGVSLLARTRQVLDSVDVLKRHAAELSIEGVEPRLTLVLSDTFQSTSLERFITLFAERFPDVELEFLFGEEDDVLHLVDEGRAQLGFIAARPHYPATLAHQRLDAESRIGVFAAKSHPLVKAGVTSHPELSRYRELRLGTYLQGGGAGKTGLSWSSPSYLMLLEMTRIGAGWAELPEWLVENYGGDMLQQLDIPGWPRSVRVDMVWSRRSRPGPALAWTLQRLSSGGQHDNAGDDQ